MLPEDTRISVTVDPAATGTTQVSLSPDLWHHVLEEAGDEELAQKVAVALSPASNPSTTEPFLRSIVCWASKRENAKDKSSVHLSTELLRVYPYLRTSEASRVAVHSTRLVDLTEVVLLALSSDAYDYAQQVLWLLGEALAGQILRQGEVVRVEDRLPYRVIMSEPVLQGLATSQTRYIVAPSATYAESRSSVSEEDDEDIDISEAFLATSLIDVSTPSQLPNGSVKANGVHGHAHDPLTSPDPVDEPPSISLTPQVAATSISYLPERQLLHPMPLEDEDDLARTYMTPTELARFGLFSGAWVVIGAHGTRAVRVFPLPAGHAATGPQVYLPPTLLFNLASASDKAAEQLQVSLKPLRLGRAWHFPTAAMVTVSRICSPLSVDRQYQPLFLNALKLHFEQCRRVVCAGDLIAVPINAALAKLLPPSSKEDVELESDQLPLASQEAPTDLVYFKLTAVDVDTSALPPSATIALEDRRARGELGAYIDPLSTKMVQAGTSQSLVPTETAASYFAIAQEPAPPMTTMTSEENLFSRLVAHIKASLRPESNRYDLPLSVLLRSTGRGSGKSTLARWTAARVGMHLLEIDCFDLVGETDVKTEGHLRARFDKAATCAPCIFLLTHVEALARKTQTVESGQEPAMAAILQDCLAGLRAAWKTTGDPVVVIGTTAVPDRIPASVLACFKTEFVIEAPGEAERLEILRSLLRRDHLAPDVALRSIAVQTAALVANDLVDLVSRTRARALQRAQDAAGSEFTSADLGRAGISLTSEDFNAALDKARASYSESIGAPKIPNVTWDDVGGLANVRSEILDTIQLPLERPELFADGLKKRSGILLYGPPGTGKTLLAKAVATSCSLNFFSVKGPELLNMYIGESEANVRRVFQRARDAKPCVIFFDELDSVAPKRGNQGDSGGVMDRIVSQLLAELDGMSDGRGGADVFVVGATNRPDLLDPALLRPGRFDRMLYLGVSDTHDAQLRILQALTRKFRLAPTCDLAMVAETCPFNYTGADFYALCSDAMLKAMSRKAEAVEEKIGDLNGRPPYSTGEATKLTPQYYLAELATPDDVDVLVGQQDFEAALRELVPSVSAAEMEHYATVQKRFSGETLNAKKANGYTVDSDDELPKSAKGKGKGKARAD